MTDQPPISPASDPAFEHASLPRREPMFRVPPVTGLLIAINVLIHVVRQLLPPAMDDTVINFMAYDTSAWLSRPSLLTLLTYQFLHANWLHLVVNMTSLLAFGSGLERVLPGYRFLLFYLVCGVMGALFETATTSAGQDEVLVGASASISGVFGALIILLGLNRLGNRPVSLVLMIALVTVPMVVMGIFNIGSGGLPVAWRAHVGGFAFGMISAFGILALRRRRA